MTGMNTEAMPTAGKQTDQLVELLDLFPTLCDLAKIDTPDFVDGKSLTPILADTNATIHSAAVSQYYRRTRDNQFMGYSIRPPTHRMIEWREFATGKLAARELYDHQQDHSETVNVIDATDPKLIAEISQLLNTTHPPKQLELTPAIHSSSSELPASISFANQTDGPIFVYHVSKRGARAKSKKQVKPGAMLNSKTKFGNVFVVENQAGTIHEIHSPSIPARTIEIRAPKPPSVQ